MESVWFRQDSEIDLQGVEKAKEAMAVLEKAKEAMVKRPAAMKVTRAALTERARNGWCDR